ncbi:MAG: cytochrome c [Proteobacteria bacterium]|nr:cytochrome c [Pseudomonadota bacterium]
MAQAGRTARGSDAARSGAARLHPPCGLAVSSSVLTAVVAALSFIAIPAAASAQSGPPSTEDLKRGEELLAKNCGQCHAVGRTGNSPRPDAPAFRVLGQRYPIDSLEESLGEGIMSGHPDMPEISFESDDVGAIIDYLKAIQVKR